MRCTVMIRPEPDGTFVALPLRGARRRNAAPMRRLMEIAVVIYGLAYLEQNPYSGHVFVFRGRRGDLVKLIWFDGDGLYLFVKRLEPGRFVWTQPERDVVSLSRAPLSMLLEGISTGANSQGGEL